VIDNNGYIIPDVVLEESKNEKVRKSKSTSINDLKRRAENKPPNSSRRTVITTQYDRDPYVVEYALRRANGICQLCLQPAPFIKLDGEPFLEVHHIQFLASEGTDTVDNAVALCPNCHRKMHHCNFTQDQDALRNLAAIELI
jgi:5-methylcytosine-specific restriction protein A